MKLGNISQTIVPVPNFFMDQKGRPLETFQLYNKTDSNFYRSKIKSKIDLNPISIQNNNTQSDIEEISSRTSRPFDKFFFKRQNSNSYFRDRDVLTTFYNLNINHNPRNFSRQWLLMNKEKYIPIYHQKNYPDLTEMKKTYFPDIVDLNAVNKKKHGYKQITSLKCLENFYDYKNYKARENLEEFLEPNMRDDIKNNTKNLIDRINMNYDIKKYSDFNSRTTYNRFFQTAYSPINNVIQNTDSLKNKFGDVLKQKALSLKTINDKTRKIIERAMNNSDTENDMIKNNNTTEENIYDDLLNNCESNLLNLKYNNCEAPKYSSKDKKFINENKYITQRLNRSKLFKDFPSKTREEFNEKKIIIPKSLQKNSKYDGNVVLRDKYGKYKDRIDKIIEKDYLKKMWIRPLHEDAYKIHE
jgi:hypothetical protein